MPVLGYVDDLILVPAGIALAIHLVPAPVMAECRRRAADAFEEGEPVSRAAAVAVIVVWALIAAVAAAWLYRVALR